MYVTAGKTRFDGWEDMFLRMARLVALKSKDPSTQTGCVITTKDHRLLSMGYNGFPVGVDDNPERYADRELKLRLVAHCDRNAIDAAARLGIALAGSTMYLTGPPCGECTKSIIQAGIDLVVWPTQNPFWDDAERRARWADDFVDSKIMLDQSKVGYRDVDCPYYEVTV